MLNTGRGKREVKATGINQSERHESIQTSLQSGNHNLNHTITEAGQLAIFH